MVDRFQQQDLASARTGLPREDHSQSTAAAMVARIANSQRDQLLQEASQHYARAEGSFNQAGAYAQQLAAGLAANREAAAEERRKLQVSLARIDEDDNANAVFKSYTDKYAENPQDAAVEFEKDIPNMRAAFKERYKDDERALTKLMPYYHQNEKETLAKLQSWGDSAVNSRLSKRLQLLPEELSNKIDNLDGSMDQQYEAFQKLITSSSDIYHQMKVGTKDQAKIDEIDLQHSKLKRQLSRQFVSHLMTQTPDGEEGMNYIDSLRNIVGQAQKVGIPLSSEDQNKALEHLHSQRNIHEQEVITSIKSDTDLRVLDANKLKADLINAADDPKQLSNIAGQVQNRLQELDNRIEQVGKEPDSRIKKAKLAGLKQEQNSFISELGTELKLTRSFEQLQRTLTSYAQSQIRFQQSQIGWAQGQMRFNQGQADRVERIENKAARESKVQRVDSFNNDWGLIQNRLQSAWAKSPGQKQQQEISKIVNEAVPMLNLARASGTITSNSYGKYLNQLKKQTETAALRKVSEPFKLGFISWGGGEVKTLKGDAAKKATADAGQKYSAVVKQNQANFRALQDSFGQLNVLTTSKTEKAALTQYLHANMPRLLDSPGYKKLSPQKQSQARANVIRRAVQSFRAGDLD